LNENLIQQKKLYDFVLKATHDWISMKYNKKLFNIIYDFQYKMNLDLSFQTKNQTHTNWLWISYYLLEQIVSAKLLIYYLDW